MRDGDERAVDVGAIFVAVGIQTVGDTFGFADVGPTVGVADDIDDGTAVRYFGWWVFIS